MRESESTLAWQARRIEFLEQENADLRKKLGHSFEEEAALALNRRYRLRPSPARIAAALYIHGAKRPVSKTFLLERIGSEADPKCIDVWIWYIRQKLGSDTVETYWGVGYIMPEAGRIRVEAALAELRTPEARTA